MTILPGEAAEAAAEADARALAAHLEAAPSVTSGLLSWCEARGIGAGPIRVLSRSGGAAPARLAALLSPPAGARTAFRRVVLGRGAIAIVEAENLFLPDRLPDPMRQSLAATDVPFGAVLAPLRPVRRTVSRREGEAAGPGAVLAVEALVLSPGGKALAAVAERFLPALLGRF